MLCKRIEQIINLLSDDHDDLTRAMGQEDDDGNNTFMIAIKNGFISIGIGGAFAENIDNINHTNKKGETALTLLVKSKKIDLVLKNALLDKIKRNGGEGVKPKRKSSTKKRRYSRKH